MQGAAGQVSRLGRWARRELGLRSVTTHSLPPHSFPRKGACFGLRADKGATCEAATEPEAPPISSLSRPAPERRAADTLQRGEFEVFGARVEDRAEGGIPPFACLWGGTWLGREWEPGGLPEPTETSCPYLAGAAYNPRVSSAHTEHHAGRAPRCRQKVFHSPSGSLLRKSLGDPTWRRALGGSVT